jgi:hypothetical protein
MSDVEASETDHAQGAEEPPKRGRGRPKGSLNKATIARREAEEAVTEMPLEAIVEADDEAAPAAKPKRASRKKAAPPPETVPDDLRSAADGLRPAAKPHPHPPEPETVPEPEPVPQPPQAPRIPDRSAARAAEGGMPAKPKRAPRKPRVLPALPAAPRPAVGGERASPGGGAASASASATLLHEASLLDIMRAGLEHARTKHKRDRVAQYDAMFAY